MRNSPSVTTFPHGRRTAAPRQQVIASVSTVLLLVACSPAEVSAPDDNRSPDGPSQAGTAPTPTSPGRSATTTSAAPTPKPTPKPPPKPKSISAGTVTDTRSSRSAGSGSAEIRNTRKGNFGVVARLDCSRCRGRVVLTAPGRGSPWEQTTGPVSGSYLIQVTTDEAAKSSVQLTASGPWRLTFLSWNRLPAKHGHVSGHGSDVVFMADQTKHLRVGFRPATKGYQFDARVFSLSGDSLIFGDDHAFTETEKVDLPAVVAIESHSPWTLAPS